MVLLLGDVRDAHLSCSLQEDNMPVDASFIVEQQVVRFDVADYDRKKTLVIDPELEWSTFYGGEGEDAINGITISQDGFLYFTGYTHSSTNMAYLGYQMTYGGGNFDMYFVKMDTLGNRIWGTYFGGSEGDYGTGVNVDIDGNLLVSGFSYSPDFPTTPGAFQTAFGGNIDGVLIKATTDGEILFATLFGGSGVEYMRSVSSDSEGNIYIGGSASSDSLGYGASAHQIYVGGLSNECLVKFDSDGNRIWATYLGGTGDDYSRAVGVDLEDNVYLGGIATSANGIWFGVGYDSTWFNNNDGTVAKFDTAGTLLWSTYYGGNGDDNVNGLAFDEHNNVYVAMQAGSKNGLAYNGYLNFGFGKVDAVLIKFKPDGIREWATYYGGSFEDMGKAVAVYQDRVYLVGHSYSSFGVAVGGYQNYLVGFGDAMIVRFDTTGAFYWGSYAGGYDVDYGRGVAVSSEGTIYMGGKTFSYTFPTTDGAYQEVFGGDPADGFIQKISECPGTWYYFDYDGDGYGNSFFPVFACSPPLGYVLNDGDCNDFLASIHPGAAEICNDLDDDCDFLVDSDDPDAVGEPIWYFDGDADGYGDVNNTTAACEVPALYVADSTDCNDTMNTIYPGATEVCNGLDDDCDAMVDEDVIVAAITAGGPTTFCKGDHVTLNANTGVGYLYQWKRNGNIIPGAITGSYATNKGGNYTVDVTLPGGCADLSDITTVTVLTKPSANIVAMNDTDICVLGYCKLKTNSSPGFTYQWFWYGSPIPGATNNILNAIFTGPHYVRVTNASGCSKNSATINLTSSCKLSDENTPELSIFPNPASNDLYVQLHGIPSAQDAWVSMYNAIGELVYSGQTEVNNGELDLYLNVSAFVPASNYFIRIEAGGNVYTGQWTKQ